MDHIELAKQLRANSSEHWNCCQMVVGAFAEEAGITVYQAYALAANFGGGMRMGATCGAITGGLMALGLLHAGEDAARAFLQHFRTGHGALNCAELLKLEKEQKKEQFNKQAHCDGLIYEAIGLVEELTGK